MRSTEIRRTFLEFFRRRDHRIWPSSSLIPNDPSLLLTVAGMVQFKPYFLGEAIPDHPRAASVQKCARTNDIENVGETTRHFTVFEMLGNFSFGDYFKRDAIAWAWELSTSPPPHGFGFAPERIWATVYEDDDEAERLWLSETDMPVARVVRRGKRDNFWSTGAAGPCGPCSELYYDRGPEHGTDGGPAVDETRYLEFWNLVFMQYEQDDAGTILGELPKQNVDTGMGFERMAMLLQDVPNAYETDVVRPMLDQASELTGVRYGTGGREDVFLRVIAEHSRAASFLIADGVLPSNEARGYVLRRLLRRAIRNARKLGTERPIMRAMTETVVETLGDAWPELRQQAELVTRVAVAEEEGFSRTLRSGIVMLDAAVAEAKREGKTALSGQTAFTLHDTYGFPVDLTVEIAREQGLDLDRDAFATAMEDQRTRARRALKRGTDGGVPAEVYRAAGERAGGVDFLGYVAERAETRIGAIVGGNELLDHAGEGDDVQIVLGRTPFYAEGGGQLGDHGIITTDTGRILVTDTTSPVEGVIVHHGRVAAGELAPGQDALAEIDHARRASIRRGHTATHILHATLKEVLGEHVAQAGSAIDAGRFRFDFPHFEAVARDQLAQVEEQVNLRIAADPQIKTTEMTQEQARRTGAVALFGEKYGDWVRVVEIGDYSRELCGGTHVGRAGEVGLFTILAEGSIAANLRRIEALAGPEAFAFLSRERLVADEVARLLKVSTGEVVDRVAGLLDRLRATEKELARARTEALLASAGRLVAGVERVDGAGIITAAVEGADLQGLRALALEVRHRLGSGVVVLGTATAEGTAQLVAAVSSDLAGRGVVARDVLAPGARLVGGGAGGKSDIAQAGGREGARLADALEAARAAARERLTALA
ncbi:MAG: alanine--tRNA ligase [Egibacteraceae bacterium]